MKTKTATISLLLWLFLLVVLADDPIPCYEGYCLDLIWDLAVLDNDFLMVIAGTASCSDFDGDGYIGDEDAGYWEWTKNLEGRLNFCGPSLWIPDEPEFSASQTREQAALAGRLVIKGKSGGTQRLKNALYVFEPNGRYLHKTELAYDDNEIINRCRLVYGSNIVCVGIQKKGGDYYGRPVSDIVIKNGFAYVLPVVVAPETGEPFLAAAKLDLSDTPYSVVAIYEGGEHFNEIEVFGDDVYITNKENGNNALYKFGNTAQRLDLDYIPDCLLASPTGIIYVGTPERIYGHDENLSIVRTIEIYGMQRITGLAEDAEGTLWAVGYNLTEQVPEFPSEFDPPFYYPVMAQIPFDAPGATVYQVYADGLALPQSVEWFKKAYINFMDYALADFADINELKVFIDGWLDERSEQ